MRDKSATEPQQRDAGHYYVIDSDATDDEIEAFATAVIDDMMAEETAEHAAQAGRTTTAPGGPKAVRVVRRGRIARFR